MPDFGQFTGGSNRPGDGGRNLAPSIIEYKPPEYDESQIRAYQQEAMAPGLSGLRRVMRAGQAGRYSSPSERREALRGLTRGYGEALAPLQVGAGRQARQRYDIQYRQNVKAEQLRFEQEQRNAELAYQQALKDEAEGGGPSQPGRRQATTTGTAAGPETTRSNFGWFSAPATPGVSYRGLSTGGGVSQGYQPAGLSQPEAYPDNWMTA